MEGLPKEIGRNVGGIWSIDHSGISGRDQILNNGRRWQSSLIRPVMSSFPLPIPDAGGICRRNNSILLEFCLALVGWLNPF